MLHADHPGMGKTVETIALIIRNACPARAVATDGSLFSAAPAPAGGFKRLRSRANTVSVGYAVEYRVHGC